MPNHPNDTIPLSPDCDQENSAGFSHKKAKELFADGWFPEDLRVQEALVCYANNDLQPSLSPDDYTFVVEELIKRVQLLADQAWIAPLTGVFTRRGFNYHLQQVLEPFLPTPHGHEKREKSAPPEHPVTIALVDMNNLKPLNDCVSHTAGDNALKYLARFLARNLRDGDQLCRIGGDEFAIIMDNCTEKQANTRLTPLFQHFAEESIGDATPFTILNKKGRDIPFPLSAAFGCKQLAPECFKFTDNTEADTDRFIQGELEAASQRMEANKPIAKAYSASLPGGFPIYKTVDEAKEHTKKLYKGTWADNLMDTIRYFRSR